MPSSLPQPSQAVRPDSQPSASPATPSWQIKLLYDGECPLCLREVNFLRRRDAGRGLVEFVDIASDRYNPDDHGGIDFATAMGRIHALLPDGTVVRDLEVFRRVYDVLGMGWVYAVTQLPVVGAIADWLYARWADWRLPLTGRPQLPTLLAERRAQLGCEESGRCEQKAEGRRQKAEGGIRSQESKI